jgi:hypothetical protein
MHPAPEVVPLPHRASSRWLLALIAAFALVAAACGDDLDPERGQVGVDDPQQPGWIREVFPSPGAESTGERVVELRYADLEPQQQIRLLINGVDVTVQSLDETQAVEQQQEPFIGPGQLRYDPRRIEDDMATGPPLVDLTPGTHTATARLVELPAFGEPLQIVDEYRWTFSLL